MPSVDEITGKDGKRDDLADGLLRRAEHVPGERTWIHGPKGDVRILDACADREIPVGDEDGCLASVVVIEQPSSRRQDDEDREINGSLHGPPYPLSAAKLTKTKKLDAITKLATWPSG